MNNIFKKTIVLMLVVCLVLAFAGCGKTSEQSLNYDISITCNLIAENMDAIENEAIVDLVPEDGVIFPESNVACQLPEGASVMDATIDLCKIMKISYDNSQGYMSMLGDISSGDCGGWSGWLVKVNGEFSDVGADEIEIHEGDTVEWIYSLDGGADIGAWG